MRQTVTCHFRDLLLEINVAITTTLWRWNKLLVCLHLYAYSMPITLDSNTPFVIKLFVGIKNEDYFVISPKLILVVSYSFF